MLLPVFCQYGCIAFVCFSPGKKKITKSIRLCRNVYVYMDLCFLVMIGSLTRFFNCSFVIACKHEFTNCLKTTILFPGDVRRTTGYCSMHTPDPGYWSLQTCAGVNLGQVTYQQQTNMAKRHTGQERSLISEAVSATCGLLRVKPPISRRGPIFFFFFFVGFKYCCSSGCENINITITQRHN